MQKKLKRYEELCVGILELFECLFKKKCYIENEKGICEKSEINEILEWNLRHNEQIEINIE